MLNSDISVFSYVAEDLSVAPEEKTRKTKTEHKHELDLTNFFFHDIEISHKTLNIMLSFKLNGDFNHDGF